MVTDAVILSVILLKEKQRWTYMLLKFGWFSVLSKRHHNSYLQLTEDGNHQFNVELVCIIMFKFCCNNVVHICNTVNVKMNFCLKECQCEATYNFVFVCAVLCIITVIMHIRLFCVMAPEGR